MRLVGAELLKLRTTPTPARISALALAAALFLAVSFLGVRDLAGAVPGDAQAAVRAASVSGLVVLVGAAALASSDYRHRTLAPLLVIAPYRERVLFAQAVAVAGFGALVALATALVVTAAIAALLAAGGGPPLDAGDTARAVAGTTLYGGLAGATGVGLGAALRSQPLAIGATLALLLAVEPVLASFSTVVATWGPSGAAGGLIGVDGLDVLPFGLAFGTLLAYAGLALLAGLLRSRGDVA